MTCPVLPPPSREDRQDSAPSGPALELWQGGDELPRGQQWRVLTAWPADGWWAVTTEADRDDAAGTVRVTYYAEPLIGWANVEVLEQDGERWLFVTGLTADSWPASLADHRTSYLRCLPERARTWGHLEDRRTWTRTDRLTAVELQTTKP